jgi:prevent-host-death family protein
VKKVSVAEAKAQFSALTARVAYGGEQFVIERRGKPMAALVSMEDLERLERKRASSQPRGALALIGAWNDVDDAEIDAMVEEIYSRRAGDRGRAVSRDA